MKAMNVIKEHRSVKTVRELVLQNRKLLICFGLNAIVALIAVFLFNVVEKTDDLVMKQILDGAYSGSPDAHLLYVNYIWGSILLLCKNVIPGIPWLEASQLGFLYLSFSVITYQLWDEQNNKKSLFMVLPLLLVFGLDAYVKLTFSKTAGVVSCAGYLSLMMNIRKGRSWKAYVFPVLLVVIGTFYRSKCAYLIGGMFLAFTVLFHLAGSCNDVKLLFDLKTIVRQCLPLVIMAVISFGIAQLGTFLFTRDPEWAKYKEYNEYKVELQDRGWPDYSTHEAEYLELGISRNDYEMWDGRDYSDPDRFTIELMAKVCEMKEAPDRSLLHYLRLYPVDFFRVRVFVGFIAALGLLFLSEDRKKYLIAGALVLIALGLEYFFFMGGRYGKYHIDYVIFLALAIAVCIRLKDTEIRMETLRVCPALMLILLLFLVNDNYSYYRAETYDGSENSVSEGQAKEILQELTQDKDNLYVMSNNEYYGLMRSIGISQTYEPGQLSNIFILSGYMTPTTRKVLDNRGIYNIYLEMLRQSDIYYVTSKNNRVGTIRKYLRENYCGLANYRLAYSFGSTEVYRFYVEPPNVAETPGS